MKNTQAQEDVSKMFMNLDINLSNDFEYYVREVVDGVTIDKYDVHTNTTSIYFFFIVLIILDNCLVCQLSR